VTAASVVTIDGPAGAGKTTVGGLLASRLRLPLLDTGLFYRALTVAARGAGVTVGAAAAAAELARSTRIEIDVDPERPASRALARVDGDDVTARLFDPDQADLLTWLARVPAVRTALLPAQRRLGRGGAVVLGRDAGSVVFPDAACKLYLDARCAVRAARRAAQLEESGGRADPTRVRQEVERRDRSDRERRAAPLRVPSGATVIRTDSLTVAAAVEAALAACRRAGVAIARGPGDYP